MAGIPYDQDARREEDERIESADRKLARLAAAELAKYAGLDEYDAWRVFTRVRALVRKGVPAAEIHHRLHP